MKISVITVCFNAKETIEDTFLSVFDQTYPDIELIVIDGGSTDGTLQVVEKHRDKIAYFTSEPDDGIYDAMNKGIKASGGDLLFFLNANDVFKDDKVLEKVTKVLEENADAKILFGNVEYLSESGETSKIQTYEKMIDDFALLSDNICHQCIFYHKSLFEDFGLYSKEFKLYADWDFNIKTLIKARVSAIYLPITVSKFRQGGISSTPETLALCKAEKNMLIDKYRKNYKFLIKVNSFLKNHVSPLYPLLNGIIVAPVMKIYASRAKFRLNIKTVKV